MKKAWPDRAMVVSLMVPCDEESWKAILRARRGDRVRRRRAEFRLPARHVASAAWARPSARCPEYIEMVARWCKQHTRMPVIVKLTPNITDIRFPARAATRGGADAVSLINTVSSIMSIDLDRMAPDADHRRQGHRMAAIAAPP